MVTVYLGLGSLGDWGLGVGGLGFRSFRVSRDIRASSSTRSAGTTVVVATPGFLLCHVCVSGFRVKGLGFRVLGLRV